MEQIFQRKKQPTRCRNQTGVVESAGSAFIAPRHWSRNISVLRLLIYCIESGFPLNTQREENAGIFLSRLFGIDALTSVNFQARHTMFMVNKLHPECIRFKAILASVTVFPHVPNRLRVGEDAVSFEDECTSM